MLSSYRNLLKIKPYIKNCKFYFYGGILGMILCSIIATPISYLIGYTIDKIIILHKSYSDLYKIIAILTLLHLARYFLTILSKNFFIKVENFVINHVRISMIDKIIDLPMSFLGKVEKGYILRRITECENIGAIFSPIYINTVINIFDLIFSVIMMINLSYKLTIVVLIIVPIYFFTVKHSSDKLSESTKLMLETEAILSGETYEVLNGIEEIKILNGKNIQLNKFKNKLDKALNSCIKQSKEIVLFMENMSLVNNLASILILLFSGIFILDNQLTIGIYTAFVGYINKVFIATSDLASFSITLKPVCISIGRVQEFLEIKNENEENGTTLSEDITNISIKNLSFKYNDSNDFIILNLNFEMNKGDRVLIKGENGTGKSTLIKNLLGLYSPPSGKIFINDKNYSMFNKTSIRKKIGVVSQNVFLFRGSVLENILYGQNCTKTKKDVIKLIDRYKLNEYIESFEDGLETKIEQNGIGISGGQAQIIAFLRSTLSKKDIIILDEGTSNVDIKTRKIIFNILKDKDLCNILIIISHQSEEIEFINKTLDLKKLN